MTFNVRIVSYLLLLTFLLIYHRSSAIRCNHTLTGPSGRIATTSSEAYNSDDHTCQWNIRVDQGKTISLIFERVDFPDIDVKIKFDANVPENWKQIEKKCEKKVKKKCSHNFEDPILSTGNELSIQYKRSEDSITYGFIASYYSITTGCGANLTEPSGVFTSPGYPSKYGTNEDCQWTITVDRGRRITLKFIKFHVGGQYLSRSKGKVVVYNGENTRSPRLGVFCGSNDAVLVESNGNSMTIHFTNVNRARLQGFLAVYNATETTVSSASEAPKKTQIVALAALLALALLTILGLLGYIAFLRHKKAEDIVEMQDRNAARTSTLTETNAPRSNHLDEPDEMEIEDNITYDSFDASRGIDSQQGAAVSIPSKAGPITGEIYSAVDEVYAGNIYANN